MPVPFAALRANYPTEAKDALFAGLGGQWPSLVNDARYRNTCAIRLSVALRKSGLPIPATYREAISGDGQALTIKVKTMGDVVRALFGQSYWGMSKQPGAAVVIPKKTGIVVYHAAWADATGHFDLWTGTGFVGPGNLADVGFGFDVELWYIP